VPVAHAYDPRSQEAEIKRVEVQSQPGQIVLKTLSQKNSSLKRTGGVAQDVGPEFKPQYCKKKEGRLERTMRYLIGIAGTGMKVMFLYMCVCLGTDRSENHYISVLVCTYM
jgi:hypothetical protein